MKLGNHILSKDDFTFEIITTTLLRAVLRVGTACAHVANKRSTKSADFSSEKQFK